MLWQVLVVGAVISLVAQVLTLVSVLRRLHTHPSESASLILLNAELSLTAGNLVFLFGVQVSIQVEPLVLSTRFEKFPECATVGHEPGPRDSWAVVVQM